MLAVSARQRQHHFKLVEALVAIHYSVMVGGIIRYGRRHHLVMTGGLDRNQQTSQRNLVFVFLLAVRRGWRVLTLRCDCIRRCALAR
jgi:hypothetical protein